MRRTLLVMLILTGALVISGCSGRQQQWESARRADTLEAYQRFLQSYPDGEFASQAQARVRELQEVSDWQKAMQVDTADAYQEFLNRYPQGRMSDEARIRLGNIALALTPSDTPSDSPTTTAPQAAASAAAPATDARAASPQVAPVAREGAYRIQLGAFAGGDKQAMSEWRRLQGAYPQLLVGLSPSVKLATTPAGHLYRLQAGTMSEARARQTCTSLKSKNEACVVVKP